MTDSARLCADCGQPFDRPLARAIYCSPRCKDRNRDRKRRARPGFQASRSEYQRSYREANRERLRLKSEIWNAANRDTHNALSRKWAREHKHSTPKSWRSEHLPERATTQRLRNARIRAATPFPLDHAAVIAKVAYWGNKCWMCGGPFESLDHVKPISRGGLNILANLRPACVSCNSRKHNSWHGPLTLSMFIRE